MAVEYGKDVIQFNGKIRKFGWWMLAYCLFPIAYSAGMSAESRIHENVKQLHLLLCENFILQKTLCSVMHSPSATIVCVQFPFIICKGRGLSAFNATYVALHHSELSNFLILKWTSVEQVLTRFRNQLQFWKVFVHIFLRRADEYLLPVMFGYYCSFRSLVWKFIFSKLQSLLTSNFLEYTCFLWFVNKKYVGKWFCEVSRLLWSLKAFVKFGRITENEVISTLKGCCVAEVAVQMGIISCSKVSFANLILPKTQLPKFKWVMFTNRTWRIMVKRFDGIIK